MAKKPRVAEETAPLPAATDVPEAPAAPETGFVHAVEPPAPIPGISTLPGLTYNAKPETVEQYEVVKAQFESFIRAAEQAWQSVQNPTANWGPSDWDKHREAKRGIEFRHPSTLKG